MQKERVSKSARSPDMGSYLTQNDRVSDCLNCGERRRGRPPIHPLWFDRETKTCRSLRQHPNYELCKNFIARAFDSDAEAWAFFEEYGRTHQRLMRSEGDEFYLIVPEWKNDVAKFTYEVGAEIGMRPPGSAVLQPVDPTQPIGPGNVMWMQRLPGRHGVQRARRELEGKKVAAAQLAELDLVEQEDGSFIAGWVLRSLRALGHLSNCEMSTPDPADCHCTESIRDKYRTF